MGLCNSLYCGWLGQGNDSIMFVDSQGNKYWYKDSLLHRVGGPAIVLVDGTEYWYVNGELLFIDSMKG